MFLSYVNQVLAPQLWAGAILVMDNLKVHHAHSVRCAIEAVGAQVVFLPPYSPDLSPIELCLSSVQPLLLFCSVYPWLDIFPNDSLELGFNQLISAMNQFKPFYSSGWSNLFTTCLTRRVTKEG